MNVFLYGAGRRGKKIENLLFSKKIIVKGIADSNKAGNLFDCGSSRIYKILSKEELLKTINGERIIITINNPIVVENLTSFFQEKKISVITYECLMKEIEGHTSVIEINRNTIADYHLNQMEDYYDNAEKNLDTFWGESTIFYKMFKQLDITNIVELACGHGRHVTKYYDLAGHITLVDILSKNIDFCKKRFGVDKISYYVNNGFDLSELQSGIYTSIFSYDSMVHFELFDIFNYLKETYRILRQGGMGLFHHSNNDSDYRISFTTGKNGRNFMSKDIFAYLVNRVGLEVVSQEIYDWSKDGSFTDCITLIRKP